MLRAIRLAKGIGLCELARVSGVSTSTIQGIEREAASPKRSTRNRLALALGCRPQEIAPEAEPACTAEQAARIVALLNDQEWGSDATAAA